MTGREDELKNILNDHTKFGMTETHKIKADHAVLDRKEFREIPLLKGMIDKAYKQLGTSGGGNHFVEFGIVDIEQTLPEWKLKPGSLFCSLVAQWITRIGCQYCQTLYDPRYEAVSFATSGAASGRGWT
jgi:tRNA-splicing ligase RtcB